MRSVAPVTQSHLSKPDDLMLQNATSLSKSALWPPNISDENMSLVLRLPRKMHLADPLEVSHACKRSWNCSRFAHFWQGAESLAKPRFNVQNWHQYVAFYTFWLRNVPCATTACTFWTSQLPKVLRTRHFITRTHILCEPAQSKCTFNMTQETSKELLKTEIYRKNATAQIEPARGHTFCASLRSRNALQQHFTRDIRRATLYRNLQEKCRAPARAQNAGTHFVRACAVETHGKISQ